MSERWEGFFETEAWQDVQLGWVSVEDAGEQADRVVCALGLEVGERVLDVPCGDGRLATELAARGFAVTGVDVTDRFIETGWLRAAERGVGVDLRAGDMREPLGGDAELKSFELGADGLWLVATKGDG